MGIYESPDYDILEAEGNCEVRHYSPFQVVRYFDERDPRAEQGFRTLFRYIQADNESGQTISMTVPVLQENRDHVRTMSFVVPAKHRVNPPQPHDPRLQIVEMEGGIYAAIGYRGAQSQVRVNRHQEQLESWIHERGWDILGMPVAAFYNPPFTPSFLKHNEVLMRIHGWQEDLSQKGGVHGRRTIPYDGKNASK